MLLPEFQLGAIVAFPRLTQIEVHYWQARPNKLRHTPKDSLKIFLLPLLGQNAALYLLWTTLQTLYRSAESGP